MLKTVDGNLLRLKMLPSRWIWTAFLFGITLADGIWGLPENTTIDCQNATQHIFQSTDEGYEGLLERIAAPDVSLRIDCQIPSCSDFLKLIRRPGQDAEVIITIALDAEELTEYNGILSYSIICQSDILVRNDRTLKVNDINDNAPVFDEGVCSKRVSEFLPVGSVVVQVKATDADASPQFNTVTYSIEEPSDTFEVISNNGSIMLKKQLNYAETKFYTFTVTAKDPGGKADNATVNINVTGGPYFEHTIYHAVIHENEIGLFQSIAPAPIKAYGTDEDNNRMIIYSIKSVHPSEYRDTVDINRTTAVITVQKALVHEKTPTVNCSIQASLEHDSQRTADAMVIIHVNQAPMFLEEEYRFPINHAVASGDEIGVVEATDPDVGETEMLQYSLVESSSMFAVNGSSGQIYAVTDIKETRKETMKVKATDPHGLFNTTTVEVTIVIDSIDFVQIIINKPAEDVKAKVPETERALERALELDVAIMTVTSNGANHAAVRFIAMDTDGNIVPSADVTSALRKNEQTLQEGLKEVFGHDTQAELPGGTGTDNTLTIALATTMPLVAIGGIGVIFAGMRIKRQRERGSSTKGEGTGRNGPFVEDPSGTEMAQTGSSGNDQSVEDLSGTEQKQRRASSHSTEYRPPF